MNEQNPTYKCVWGSPEAVQIEHTPLLLREKEVPCRGAYPPQNAPESYLAIAVSNTHQYHQWSSDDSWYPDDEDQAQEYNQKSEKNLHNAGKTLDM